MFVDLGFQWISVAWRITRHRASLALAGAVIALGCMVMFGWAISSDDLTRVLPGLVSMKYPTAQSFLYCGMALIMARSLNPGWQSLSVALSAWVIAVMLFGVVFPGESRFAGRDTLDGSVGLGVPSIGTLLAFINVSLSNIRLVMQPHKFVVIGYTTTIFLGTTALIGYLVDVPFMYYHVPNISTAMAVHTAGGFLLLGIAGLLQRPSGKPH